MISLTNMDASDNIADALPPEIPSPQPAPGEARCPYLGLDAFEEGDSDLFFGRERLVRELLDRLAASRMLVVVGPSGSGKSSAVRAGLAPALKAGALPGSTGWRFTPAIVPGAEPLASLSRLFRAPDGETHEWIERQKDTFLQHPGSLASLVRASSDTPVIVVVDQFEEVFTLCEDERARDAFIANLLALTRAPGPRHSVVLTMRSDFESFAARLPALQAAFERGMVRVAPPSAAELRQAIVRPAEQVGLRFEESLADALLADILGEPAALPLLQWTLLKLWENRAGDTLTWEAYRRLGGGRLALTRSADSFYAGLPPAEQATARRIMLQMVRQGDGLEVTSGRVRRAALYTGAEAPAQVDRVLEKLIGARLVRPAGGNTPESEQFEIAHEALARGWPRLLDWLAEERSATAARRELEARAAEWVRRGKPVAGLLDGAQLVEAARALATAGQGHGDDLPALVEASRAAIQAARQAEAERESELARARVETDLAVQQTFARARARRRIRLLAAALIALAALLAVAFVFALVQAGAARRNDELARALALTAGAQSALSQGNDELARALVIAAASLEEPAPQAQLALADAAYAPGTRRILAGHALPVYSVAITPDGKEALSASGDKTLVLWDLATGQSIRRFEGHTGEVRSVAISPDGKTAISGSSDMTLILWDLASGQVVHRYAGHADRVNTVAFSPDGQQVLSGSSDQALILWDLASGRTLQRFEWHTGAVTSVAISPDGKTALSGSADKTLILWDLATAEVVRRFNGHADAVTSVAFSPDGRQALSGSADRSAILWDVATGQVVRRFEGHERDLRAVAFSFDGRLALTGASDSTVRVWDVTGRLVRTLAGHGAAVQSVAFTRDDRHVLSGSADTTLRLWDLGSGAQIRQLATHTAGIWRAALGTDGQTVLSASEDGTLTLSELASGKIIRPLAGHPDGVRDVAIAPDGKTALSGSADKTLILWDLATGQPIRHFEGHAEGVNGVAIAPDGKTALSASDDASLILWDLATGQELRRFEGHGASVRAVTFSPDGAQALSGSDDKTLILWDVGGGQPIHRFSQHSNAVHSVAFSPDGTQALSGSADMTIVLWDIATGQAIRRYTGHDNIVRSVAFAPDGRSFVSASADGSVRLWRVDSPAELVEWARANRYVPALTCDQRRLYRLEPSCT
jgi:WD40 repeat protein